MKLARVLNLIFFWVVMLSTSIYIYIYACVNVCVNVCVCVCLRVCVCVCECFDLLVSLVRPS